MNNKKMVRTIGIVYNLKKEGVNSDQYEEYDEWDTITALEREIKALGFEVILLEQNESFLERINSSRPDFVVNIAEGIGSSRMRESQVPCILESLSIPYTGSDPLALGITLDKYLTNKLLKASHVPVPEMHMIAKLSDIEALKGIFKQYRNLIVKPRWEGSSKGIFLTSVVSDFQRLKEQAERVLNEYNQPVVIEEFLEKSEITVGVCGNRHPRLLGMMKIMPRSQDKQFIYSQEIKRQWQEKVTYEPQQSILHALQSQVEYYAFKAFMALELRDVARIDFRVNSHNIPKIIDINPLPGLSPTYSDLPILCRLKEMTYSQLIRIILKEAFARYGLKPDLYSAASTFEGSYAD